MKQKGILATKGSRRVSQLGTRLQTISLAPFVSLQGAKGLRPRFPRGAGLELGGLIKLRDIPLPSRLRDSQALHSGPSALAADAEDPEAHVRSGESRIELALSLA